MFASHQKLDQHQPGPSLDDSAEVQPTVQRGLEATLSFRPEKLRVQELREPLPPPCRAPETYAANQGLVIESLQCSYQNAVSAGCLGT